MWLRGVRGATVVRENTKEAIIDGTREMLQRLIEVNGIEAEDICSAFFSTTSDLNAEFPAVAARGLGWTDCALMCFHDMTVPGALARCVRVMVHWNTTKTAKEIKHIYMNGAEKLRPDLIKQG
ncbi:MAG: chorismate mutase [Anaerolineae bacterium]|nr:chorismate mutase [Anaerolineae bacterium]